jgi:hypothetical protein
MNRSRFTLVHDAVAVADATRRTKRAPIEKADPKKPGRKRKTAKNREGDSLTSKLRTKASIKKCTVSSDFYGALDATVREMIKSVAVRAENIKAGRHTPKAGPLNSKPKQRGVAKLERVGVWDLGAWLGGLPRFLERCNEAQTKFVFYSVKATVPAGTVRRPEGIAAWHLASTGARITAVDRQELADNIIADDFFPLADVVRKDLGLDYIVGVTPSMIAGTDDGAVYWNHFSTHAHRTILVSTYDLRDFAKATNRPFEVYLGSLVLAQLMVACNSRLEFHDDRGCLLDYNKSRVSIQATVANMHIEPACLDRIAPRYRVAATALTEALRTWETT